MREEAKRIMSYQDIRIGNTTISKGERECEDRYQVIKKNVLDKYNRPFTLLDIGAAQGYFGFRIAEDYPQSTVVMIEKDYNELVKLCNQNSAYLNNVIVLGYDVDISAIRRLTQCEHFDIALVLNVLHHFNLSGNLESEAKTLLSCVVDLADNVIIESPPTEDCNATGEHLGNGLIQPIMRYLGEFKVIGTASRHTSGVEGKIYLSSMFTHELTSYRQYHATFYDEPDNDNDNSNDNDNDNYSWIVESSYDKIGIDTSRPFLECSEEFIPKKFKCGINLRTFECLNGVWPSRPRIVEGVDYSYESTWGDCRDANGRIPQHNDIRPWNFIISGVDLRLIDGGDERAIYDDTISLDKVKSDLGNSTITSVDGWSKIGLRRLCVLTPFRNARKHLSTYFDQLIQLRNDLQSSLHMDLRLVAAEGDSTDNTRQALHEHANNYDLDFYLVDTTHGKRYWRSVEDPDRLSTMSNVMNAALDNVNDDDTLVLWIMGDVIYDIDDIIKLISNTDNNRSSINAPLALNHNGSAFWDTWGYRKDGRRFNINEPYFESSSLDEDYISIDSAGTCLCMSSSIAKRYRADKLEAVSFCNNARADNVRIRLFNNLAVYHNYDVQRRLLFIGEILSFTGLSRASMSVLPELSSLGYDVDIIGVGYNGQPHHLPYDIYPAEMIDGDLDDGSTQLYRLLMSKIKYDIIIIATDPWSYGNYLEAVEQSNYRNDYDFKLVAWTSADSENIDASKLNGYDHVIAWTQYGRDKLNSYNGSSSIVPLGIDMSLFTRFDDDKRLELRQSMIPDSVINKALSHEDLFIIGFVGRNQPRKRIDELLRLFSQYIDKYDDTGTARLLLHSINSPYPGCDILALEQHYGLGGRIIHSNDYVNDSIMAHLYNLMDVFITVSSAEGWCYPVMEAISCGVNVIVPDIGPVDEWLREVTIDNTTIDNTPGNFRFERSAKPFVIAPINDKKGPRSLGYTISDDASSVLHRFRQHRPVDIPYTALDIKDTARKFAQCVKDIS